MVRKKITLVIVGRRGGVSPLFKVDLSSSALVRRNVVCTSTLRSALKTKRIAAREVVAGNYKLQSSRGSEPEAHNTRGPARIAATECLMRNQCQLTFAGRETSRIVLKPLQTSSFLSPPPIPGFYWKTCLQLSNRVIYFQCYSLD